MNKQKLKKRQLAAKQKRINRKESEDSTGVQKRKRNSKPEMRLDLFYLIKAILIVSMIFSFFVYSTLLLPLFIAYTSLYYFSSWVERKINRRFNKENQKKIFKFDAAVAFITIVVALSSTIYSFSTMVGNRFNSISNYFFRIMSLGTGVRKKGNMSFGTGTRPEGFSKPTGGSTGSMTQRPPKPDFDLNDLPIEFVFNQILSSIVQILVFSVIILGTISVLYFGYKNYIKKDRLKIKENEKTEWKFNQDDLIKLLEEEI